MVTASDFSKGTFTALKMLSLVRRNTARHNGCIPTDTQLLAWHEMLLTFSQEVGKGNVKGS